MSILVPLFCPHNEIPKQCQAWQMLSFLCVNEVSTELPYINHDCARLIFDQLKSLYREDRKRALQALERNTDSFWDDSHYRHHIMMRLEAFVGCFDLQPSVVLPKKLYNDSDAVEELRTAQNRATQQEKQRRRAQQQERRRRR